MTQVLIVDDDPALRDLLARRVTKAGHETQTAASAEEGLEVLEQHDIALVVTDLDMPGLNGVELCERIVGSRPNVPVIVVTAFGSLETAVSALRAGAFDFITKPFEFEMVMLAIERALRHRSLLEEVSRLRVQASVDPALSEMMGDCPAMKKLLSTIGRVARSDASVLICGESGTGKELVARALHQRGPRAERPFVAINCAAMPENLLESELFGHEKGAFTGAVAAHKGLFRQADGGTLFLDEIGELPLTLQPKLLRALEQRTVRPVGGKTETPFDVRLVAATNRDLEIAADEGRFREDLYYRINVVSLNVPPLRERGTDILLLATRFLEEFAARGSVEITNIAAPAADKLLSYSWPGNVRELRNCIERAVALAEFDKITVDDLPEKIRAYRTSHVLVAAESPAELVTMEEVERRYIARVLQAVGGSRSRAAQVLGLDRKTLYRKIKRYGIEAPEDSASKP